MRVETLAITVFYKKKKKTYLVIYFSLRIYSISYLLTLFVRRNYRIIQLLQIQTRVLSLNPLRIASVKVTGHLFGTEYILFN
jgi:hypothetical protein